MNYRVLLTAVVLTLWGGTIFAASGFLSDYSKLKTVQSSGGQDQIYVAPEGFKRIVNYTAVMVDQPEILFSADSEYKGMTPTDAAAIGKVMQDSVTKKLQAGRYTIVDKPGPNVLFVREALTELYLKKKKRPLVAYTPVGFVVNAGVDALKDTLNKFDIIEMTFEGELTDSKSGEILAQLVSKGGARKAQGQKEERMNMDQFRAKLDEWSGRLRCRLDNAKLPEAQWIDCTDAIARQTREGAAP